MPDDDRYELIIARYGTRPTVRSDVFLNYSVYGEPDGPIVMDYYVWIARNAERTIIIDTGFSREGGDRRGRNTVTTPVEIWNALGVDPASAPPVVVTHAHFDHIGNLDHFPASEIIIAEAEYQFWLSRIAGQRQFSHSVDDSDIDQLKLANSQGRLVTYGDALDLAPGIRVLRVGGHTPGQSIVTVETAAGTVIVASDAVHYYEEYERQMPYVAAANLVDMYAAFDTIHELLDSGRASHLVSGHDPATLERFSPIGGPLASSAVVIG